MLIEWISSVSLGNNMKAESHFDMVCGIYVLHYGAPVLLWLILNKLKVNEIVLEIIKRVDHIII